MTLRQIILNTIQDGADNVTEDQISVALGTHIIEGPADTDIIEKDPGDGTKIRIKAAFKLRTVIVSNGVATVQSIISILAGVEVTNTIPAYMGGWLGVREANGTYEFFSKDKRLDFDTTKECPIGRADRTATDISAIVSLSELGFGYAKTLYDILAIIGSKRLSGGDLQAVDGTKTLKRLEGVYLRAFANRDENNPHKMTNTENNPVTSYEIHSSTGDVAVLSEMEVGFIDNGTGGKTAIGSNEWSFYLAYHWSRSTGVGFEGYQRSTRSFVSLAKAKSLVKQGIPEEHPALDSAVLTHIIYVKGDATNFGDPGQFLVEWCGDDFSSFGGGGGGLTPEQEALLTGAVQRVMQADIPNLQNTIDNATDGIALHFDPAQGVYNLPPLSITNNVVVIGNGATLKADSDAAPMFSPGGGIFSITNTKLESFTSAQGGGATYIATATCINWNGIEPVHVDNCDFSGFRGTAIRFGGTGGVTNYTRLYTIENSRIIDCWLGIVNEQDAEYGAVFDCVINACGIAVINNAGNWH
ncbi:MAG TPA: hypothetical protein ENI23_10000, partial [bacterium]|nr:hypothetical protein [bacterium]